MLALVLWMSAGACSGRDVPDEVDAASTGTPRGFPAPPSAPYEVIDVQHGGLITGVVRLDGSAPRDTTVRPMTDQNVCGTGYVERTVQIEDERVGDAIVWLHDIRFGKRLPMERRFEVMHDDCRIVPRVQAVLSGGALNVRSDDAIAHRTRFTHLHADDLLEIVRQTDAGSVVPVESVVSRPGLVQVRCDVHPWTTGWIAVFDHPYVVLSDPHGAFVLTEVPPGRYRLVAWHERLGSTERIVEIGSGLETHVELVFDEDSWADDARGADASSDAVNSPET